MPILIESQWNLNDKEQATRILQINILIESQWNLNSLVKGDVQDTSKDINRITVEFKSNQKNEKGEKPEGILIESQWNLNWNANNVRNVDSEY